MQTTHAQKHTRTLTNAHTNNILFSVQDSGSPYFDFVESCLRHKSEMVIYEAAHAIVNMKRTSARELAPAVSVLQLFCSSPKPTLRFAAVRTLNKVSYKNAMPHNKLSFCFIKKILDVKRPLYMPCSYVITAPRSACFNPQIR